MATCPDFTLQMMMQSSGWQTVEGEPAYKDEDEEEELLTHHKPRFSAGPVCSPVYPVCPRRKGNTVIIKILVYVDRSPGTVSHWTFIQQLH